MLRKLVPRWTSWSPHKSYSTEQSNIIRSPLDDVVLPNCLLHEYIWQNLGKWENKTAIECELTGRKVSYKQLKQMSSSLAYSLHRLGLRGTLLTALPNSPDYPVAVLGALQAGMVLSGANPIYTSTELRHQAKDSGASVIITDSARLDTVIQAVKGLNVRIITTGSPRDGAISFSELTSETRPEKIRIPDDPENMAFLPYSSGTTGLPKGVELSHRNITCNLAQLKPPALNPFEETTENHQDTVPGVLPFFHIYGLVIVLFRTLSHGAKVVTLPKFEPKSFISLLKNNKDIILPAAPPMVIFLGKSSEVKPEDLKNMKCTMIGAAPASSADIDRLQEKKKHIIFQAYGLTEASPVLTYPLKNDINPKSIGPVISNTLGKILDVNTGVSLPPGESGELCFKGPQVMKGYHNNREATASTIDEEGWLHTGDIGYVDKCGHFFIEDRLKELIKVKGFQVAPAELEAVLRQHPGISDAGVTSVVSSRFGELPVAFVVPKSGTQLNVEQVQEFVASQVAPYKKIARTIVIDEIPKSAAGKILRRNLKKIAKEQVQVE